MPSTHIQLVKWSFPAFALIIGLLWYKRRKVDKTDPGGAPKPECNGRASTGTDSRLSKASADLYDSGIHIDESFSSHPSSRATAEEAVCSPRRISSSLDIPSRRSSQQPGSMQSDLAVVAGDAWFEEVEATLPDKMDIQLGSNPKRSNFDAVARSRSGGSLEGLSEGVNGGKVLKIFENVKEEEEQRVACEEAASADPEGEEAKAKEEEAGGFAEGTEPSAAEYPGKARAQAVLERDSANHSPVSGVMEGSVTDEASSEGSTDSGKGGSIKGHAKDAVNPNVYEFSVPYCLAGRLIGRQGIFLQTIRETANVKIVIKRRPAYGQKICCIEGSPEGISIALKMIRQKFPEKRHPNLTLEQLPPWKDIPWVAELVQLSLIEGVNNDVVVCHVQKPNRLFVQIPTHPTYPSLRILDANMTQLYNMTESPMVPDELAKGMIVVAKWYDKWVRVYIENPDPLRERNLVRLVDHGGYWTFSNAEMRKIRSDYLTLPFQAVEIFLANVQPKDGGEWDREAYDVVAHMCTGIVGQAQIQGYVNSNTYVNLYLSMHKHGIISLADELIARGYADPVPLENIVTEESILVP